MEISSKTGHNVELAFYKMALEVHKIHTKTSSRDNSRTGSATDSAAQSGASNDRVRLTASSNVQKPNEYSAANEMPTREPRKKKCC